MTPALSSAAPRWRRYLRFWRPDIHADTDDELRLHLESRVEDLIRAGVPREQAVVRANDEFGDVASVRAALRSIDDRIDRQRSSREWLASIRDDVRYCARSLVRARSFVATVVVAMALGLGLNAAMFSFLDEVFFRPPLGVASPGALRRFWIWHYRTGDGRPFASLNVTYPGYRGAVVAAGADAAVAAYVGGPARIGRGELAPSAQVARVTTNYLAVMGARIGVGRWFSDAENDLAAGAPVAVVSERFAERRLADSARVIGRTLSLNGTVVTVIGVVAGGFTGPDLDAIDAWVPIGLNLDRDSGPRGEPWFASESYFALRTIARVAPNANERLLMERLTAAARTRQRAGQFPDTLQRVEVGPINEARGPGTRSGEVLVATRLGAVAVLVLLIACANVVNLLLARAVLRAREIAIRLSLGVSRGRLVRLMTTEGVILATTAGAAALLAAYWGSELLRRLLLPTTHWGHSAVSWRLIAFTTLASLAAGLVIGIVPALRASRPDLTASLRSGGQGVSRQRSRLRSGLVATQAALAVVLLVTALLFVASLRNVEGIDIGFDAPRLTFANITFETEPPNGAAVRAAGYEQLASEMAAVPGIESVALASIAPMRGFSATNFFFGADSVLSIVNPSDRPTFTAVSRSYFRTVGTKIVRGRAFTEGDVGEHGVIVNQRLARVLWQGAEPLGQCLRFVTRDAPCSPVIGVAADGHRNRVVETELAPQFYLSLEDLPPGMNNRARSVIIRSDPRNSVRVLADLRARMHRIFPQGEPLLNRMETFLDADYRPYRLGATLFSAFGLLAFAVTLVGIYSTVSYSVQQRSREFSIRTALGAQLRDVVRLVLGEELRVVAAGVAAGALLMLASGGLLASLLYGVGPRNVTILGSVAVTLLGAAVVGSLGPAWRAGRANPANTLRSE